MICIHVCVRFSCVHRYNARTSPERGLVVHSGEANVEVWVIFVFDVFFVVSRRGC